MLTQLVSSDFQDQLIRGLAHRMNNILSVFHGYLGLLMDERKLDPALKEALTRIRGSAADASELIERINAIGRPASWRLRDLPLSDFFRQIRPSIEPLRRPEIELTIECPDGLPHVRIDVSRMKLAVLELVQNAIEAAASRVLIRVGINEKLRQAELFPSDHRAPAEQWLRIEVIDDGPGVPSSVARRIFDPFFSTRKKHLTAGLGLPVALGCIQQSGGTLQLRDGDGETTFEIALLAQTPQELSAVA